MTQNPPTRCSDRVSWQFAVLVALLFVCLPPRDAQAYLDPATSTLILQAIGTTIAATVFTLKMNWLKVKAFFRRDSVEIEEVPNPAARSEEHPRT